MLFLVVVPILMAVDRVVSGVGLMIFTLMVMVAKPPKPPYMGSSIPGRRGDGNQMVEWGIQYDIFYKR